MQRLGIDRLAGLSFADFELFMYDTVNADNKSRTDEARLFEVEVDLHSLETRYHEARRHRSDQKQAAIGYQVQLQSPASLKCRLI